MRHFFKAEIDISFKTEIQQSNGLLETKRVKKYILTE